MNRPLENITVKGCVYFKFPYSRVPNNGGGVRINGGGGGGWKSFAITIIGGLELSGGWRFEKLKIAGFLGEHVLYTRKLSARFACASTFLAPAEGFQRISDDPH